MAALNPMQAVDLRGPSPGFLFDPASHSIRVIVGVPGSAYLGPAALSGLSFGSVSPDGKKAIILRDSQFSLVRDLASPTPAATPLTTLSAAPDSLAWAPDSTAAVWYSRASASVYRAWRLDADPVLDDPLDVSTLGDSIASLATGAAGNPIAVAVSHSSRNGIYLLSPGNSPVQVGALPQPSTIVFDRAGVSLYAADASTGDLYEIPAFSPLATLTRRIAGSGAATDFVGLAVGGDGSLLYSSLLSEQILRVYDLASATLTAELPLDAPPSSIQALSGDTLFVLNPLRGGSDPILLLDGRSEPVVYVVPPGAQQ
jgi:sugar lactone lactonase YvrE